MASDSGLSELSSLFVSFIRNTNTDMSILLPRSRIFTLSTNNDDPLQQSQNTEDSNHQRIILVNPFTQGMIVIDGASSLEALFRENSTKIGQPPASKESIEAMKRVEIEDGEEDFGECVVCLEEFEVGGVVREMPCKHRFHGDCIEKWLGIHGSCPVCRFVMPVDEKDDGKKIDEEEGGGERRRVGSEVWFSFSFNRNMANQAQTQNQNQNQNQASNGGDSTDSTSNSRDDDGAEVEN